MAEKADPLWPVILLTVGVVTFTLLLEHRARKSGATVQTIAIFSTESAISSDDGEAEEGSLPRETLEPACEEHRRIQQLARRGSVSEALTAFAALVLEYEDNAAVHADYGYWLIRAKRFTEAEKELSRAVELNPTSALLRMNLGAAYRKGGKIDDAIRLYTEALKLRPGYIEVELALARALVVSKRPDEALSLLKGAAEHGDHESRARALLALGRLQLDAKQYDEAQKSFSRAIEWLPGSAEVRLGIARAWFNAKQAKTRGKNTLTAALSAERLAPGEARVLTLIGKAHELLGDRAQARAAYVQAVRVDPEQRYALRRLFRFDLDARNYQSAEAYAEALLSRDNSDPEHHFLVGLVAARSSSVDRARQSYLRAIEVADGKYPEAYFNLGLLEKNEGQLSQAAQMYKKAIEQRPDYVQAYNNLGVAQISDQNPLAAKASYERALEIEPTYASAWINLGELHIRAGDLDEAVRCLETAVNLRPKDADLALSFGQLLLQNKQSERALSIFERLVTRDPRSSSAWAAQAQAQFALDATEEARRSAERALELSADNSEALRVRADVARKTGRLDEARGRYLELLEQSPKDTSVRFLLAQVFYDQGELDACTRELKKILRFGGDLSQTKEWLGRCEAH